MTVESSDTRYALNFTKSADFWEVMRIVSEGHLASRTYETRVSQLLDDALRHVPMVTDQFTQ